MNMKRSGILIFFAFLLTAVIFCNFVYAATGSLDQKAYNWICLQQGSNGLVVETEDGDMVSLYSNSLAAIVFTDRGDSKRAQKIFNWFKENREEFNTLPGGFSQFRDANGFTGNPHRWMGDNAWFLIALRCYETKTGDKQFRPLAKDIEKWLRSLQDADGGLWGGYEADGKRIHKVTEGIIDALNAVEGYDDFHKNILRFLRKYRWDSQNHVFTTAWQPYNYAPDLISWGYLALGDEYRNMLSFADRFIVTKVSALDKEVKGIAFDLVDKDAIWLEVTAQMALAYKVAGMKDKAKALISEIEKMYESSSRNSEAGGIVYSSNLGTMFGPGPLWEGADYKPHLGTSCWYLMAKWGIDPMKIGREELIKNMKINR